ncbi:PAS domain-containing protein [Clostridium sp. AF37-5AT]|mgnify:CR=1 FL=1|nr:sigma 54-interacting transcriptional regulator [Clostridium sp. AF37-5AT]RHO95915.1 PAS domain-containing protein [Clostridium sp. AF37-5AT]
MEQTIVFITKAYHHYETLIQVLEKHSLNYPVYYGHDSDECMDIAKHLVDSGTKVIISTDYLCKAFMPVLNVSLISIRRSGYSFISCAIEELKTTDKLAILSRVGGYSFGRAAEEARLLAPEHIYTFEYNDEEDVPRILKKLKASGFKSIICPSWVGPLVSDYGMHYAYILLPEPDILEAIQHAEFQLKVSQRQLLSKNLIASILNLSNEGIAALDDNGLILDINDYACHLLGIQRNDILELPYSKTVLNIFDQHGSLSQKLDSQRSILTFHEQMFVYDTRSVVIDSNIKAQIIIFNSAQQIKETERSIRLKELKQGSVASATFSSIIGSSSGIRQAINKAQKYATVNSTVLITAPSGCGKELFAQSIHNASARSEGPFVVINCAALPESVLESILFGYEPGTFTGGKKEGKAGLFELSHGGTVFLDEVSEMPLNIQSRFLRVLQEREVVRLGGNRSIPVDIRVLAATNRDMLKQIREGHFREDLYHRISTLLLEIPPLSERKEDISELAHFFIFKRARELHLSVHGISPEAVKFLQTLDYSGNVRQLNNILERAMVLSEKTILHVNDIKNALPKEFYSEVSTDFRSAPQSDSLKEQIYFSERKTISDVLAQCNGNRTEAASMLGISTTTLWRKMKALRII